MATESFKHILASGEGEVLKLGPPTPGEIVIKVDPARAHSAFVAGTETIVPGGAIPLHRHTGQDEVLFVHRGQGRAVVGDTAMTVVPGNLVYAPRNTWHSLRNTGTGVLQIAWVSAPPGIEAFFRELSQLGGSADAATIQTIAQRHGLEFHPEGAKAGEVVKRPPGGRRRRHRRGSGGRGHGAQGPPGPRQAPAQAPAAAPVPAPPQPTPQPQRGRRRHRRRGRGRSGPAVATGATPPQPPSARAPHAPQPPARRQQPRGGVQRPRRGRVKEVYIEGRWVQVTGEGPVIATGRERSAARRKAKEGDDDTPAGPLSVPL